MGVVIWQGKAQMGRGGWRKEKGVKGNVSKETGARTDQQTGRKGHGPTCRHLAKPKLRKAQPLIEWP